MKWLKSDAGYGLISAFNEKTSLTWNTPEMSSLGYKEFSPPQEFQDHYSGYYFWVIRKGGSTDGARLKKKKKWEKRKQEGGDEDG